MLTLRADIVTQEHKYSRMYVRGKDSVRLRRPRPSLTPAPSKVTVDIMYGKEFTSTGKITSSMLVTQHFRAIFCTKGWRMEHTDMKMNEVVVMYLSDDQVSRPVAPPVVSPYKGIMSCFPFLFLGVSKHYARRSYNCWSKV